MLKRNLGVVGLPLFMALFVASGCSSTEKPEGTAGGSGGSAGSAGVGGTGGSAGTGGTGSGAGSAGAAGWAEDPPSAGAQDTNLGDADIVHLEGTRLYAMSWRGGLSIIDVSEPSNLQLLGSYSLNAVPFEFFVREQTVVALFSADSATGRVVLLDASDPGHLQELGSYEVPGTISDARLVDESLYVVAFENGVCASCQNEAATVIWSLDLSNPTSIQLADKMSFAEAVDKPRWQSSSVAGGSERIYLSETAWTDDPPPLSNGNGGAAGSDSGAGGAAGSASAQLPVSHVQVLDIAGASGALDLGASVALHGQLSSGSHLDEHDGVLRVVSQGGDVVHPDSPTLETFAFESSQQLVPLGSLQLDVPENDILRTVAFDGDRAFVVSDDGLCNNPRSLVVIVDLSDTGTPQQLGQIERSSCRNALYARGDRLFVIEQQTRDGGLALSLIDISDPSMPTEVDRTEFGHDVARLPSDLGRTQQAVHILEQEGLIVVPFAGYNMGSGVQLIDFTEDAVSARGLAGLGSNARRALLQDNRMLTVSLFDVSVFDIADRDAPALLDAMDIMPADD